MTGTRLAILAGGLLVLASTAGIRAQEPVPDVLALKHERACRVVRTGWRERRRYRDSGAGEPVDSL
jgi:hypothetical protein